MQQFRRVFWMLPVVMLGLGLAGCSFFDHDSSDPIGPGLDSSELGQGIYSHEDSRFGYASSTTPGITVRADLSVHHIAGQPYGNWMVNATWRSAERKVVCAQGDLGIGETSETYHSNDCAFIIVPVEVDEATGQATALLPPEFLNTVFEEANERVLANPADNAVWFQRPGLYLNFYPADEETWEYFDF